MRRLVRGPHDDAARDRIGRRHRRARLERDAAEPLAHHALLDDALGARKGRVGLARLDLVPVLDVPGRVVVELRRARRHRRERVGHGGQGLPVHDDLGRRVHREGLRGGDDRGDGLAHVAHPVHRERVVLAPDVVAAGPAAFGARTFEWQGRAQPADLLAGDDLEHAGALRRRGGVDLRDARVGVRASHERDVVHARQHDVGDVDGAARDEPRVFLALHFGAHQSRCGHPPPSEKLSIGAPKRANAARTRRASSQGAVAGSGRERGLTGESYHPRPRPGARQTTVRSSPGPRGSPRRDQPPHLPPRSRSRPRRGWRRSRRRP